jgi:hypothetical protein
MSRAKPYQARSDAPESATELSNFEKNDAVPDTHTLAHCRWVCVDFKLAAAIINQVFPETRQRQSQRESRR